MKRSKKSLKDHLAQHYVVEFQKLPEDEGGGFFACIPDLGRSTCVGDGDTLEEAYASVTAIKEHLIREAHQAGEDIPQPSPDMDAYSGVFLVRTTRELHHALAREAKAHGVSLNQLVSTRLAAATGLARMFATAEDDMRKMLRAAASRREQLRVWQIESAGAAQQASIAGQDVVGGQRRVVA